MATLFEMARLREARYGDDGNKSIEYLKTRILGYSANVLFDESGVSQIFTGDIEY